MNKELHMVFVDLEKAYDRVPRDLIWWFLRKKGVPEGYITIIQDMYNDCETLVSTRAGDTEYFQVGVGLHQGSALSPLLFILIMGVLQTQIGKEPPWVMLFADDLVICEHSRAEVELQLERWRETFESHGLRVSRGKQSTCHAQKKTKLSTFRNKKWRQWKRSSIWAQCSMPTEEQRKT